MRIKNDQAGLTLVELLVTIVVASIVTLSACTMLLFGLRINNQSTKTSMGQNTVQVLMEALEDVAAEAKNLVVEYDADSWVIADKGDPNKSADDKVFFSYLHTTNTIYSGPTTELDTEEGKQIVGTPFLENVLESYVTLSNDGLLTFDVATQQGNYSTSVYCRMNVSGDRMAMQYIDRLNAGKIVVSDEVEGYKARNSFLKVLASQYGSKGQIIGEMTNKGKYYSEWYLLPGSYEDYPSWNKDTPWCACFLSWAIAQVPGSVSGTPLPKAAHVDKTPESNVDVTLIEYFQKGSGSSMYIPSASENSHQYLDAGNFVFFNTDSDKQADHVGVVLMVAENYLYTIEGNTVGRVAVRKYAVGDTRILGYGVLKWNTNNETESE